ncbi:MAG: type I-B CRISPR-associated endonuclease Cas1b [Leptospiraceae bacterium]|nr:type I-B CRISPR-associated endonuclease Cas1b [Leptospiraceae bacterium]
MFDGLWLCEGFRDVKNSFYIFRAGTLRKKDNSLYYAYKTEDPAPDGELFSRKAGVHIPVSWVRDIFFFSQTDLNTQALGLLSKHSINCHFFNWYGSYLGSFMARDYVLAGETVVAQVEHYLDPEKRLAIAREILAASSYNLLRTLARFASHGRVRDFYEEGKAQRERILQSRDIPTLMGNEGALRRLYYTALDDILDGYKMNGRSMQPPENEVNAMISYGNALLYARLMSSIHETPLNPTVGFLHEPSLRRVSLALDLAEIFKPLLVDRLVIWLVNRKMVNDTHFFKEPDLCYLSESGRKVFTRAFDERLKMTIKINDGEQNRSYRQLLTDECHKLVAHLRGERPFEGFRIRW